EIALQRRQEGMDPESAEHEEAHRQRHPEKERRPEPARWACSLNRHGHFIPSPSDQRLRLSIIYRAPSPPWRRCAFLIAAISALCGPAASQSSTLARIAPRRSPRSAASTGRGLPVTSSTSRAPIALACIS